MAPYDDSDHRSRFGLRPAPFSGVLRRQDKREGQTPSSESLSDDRGGDPNERTDNFRQVLISGWLVAGLLAIAMVAHQPPSSADHAVGPSLVQAPSPRPADQSRTPADSYQCSDLDYAYQWC